MKRIIIPLLLASVVTACRYNIRDNYKPFEGKATVVEIRDSRYNPAGKNNYADVFLDFMPDDPKAVSQYRYPAWKDRFQYSYRSRMNLLKSWVKSRGIEVGKSYRATRFEKFRGFGSATPVVFKVYLDKPVQ